MGQFLPGPSYVFAVVSALGSAAMLTSVLCIKKYKGFCAYVSHGTILTSRRATATAGDSR